MGQKLNRQSSWPEVLAKTIRAANARPFVWGEHDCCLFAADCVLAMTGMDPAQDYRGHYQTATGAARLIQAAGGLSALAGHALGEEIPPLLAQRGDVVLVDRPEGEALGVCVGTHGAFVGPERLEFLPMSEFKKAWRV